MAISVISVSSDSSEESVGTSTGRLILFGTIPTTIPDTTPIPTISPTIPPSPDYTPASPDYSPASDTEFDLFEDPSSDHIPPLPATSPFLSSTDDSLDSDIPNIPPSPTHGTPFTETTLSTQRSPTASASLSSPTLGALSYARADLLPSPKRIRSPEIATDLEGCSKDSFEPYVPREAGLGVDFKDESFKPSRSRGEEIDECIAYADALRDRRIDARVVVEAIDQEEIGTGVRGPVEVRVDRVTHPVVADDIPEPTQEGAVKVKYETLGDLVQRFHDHTEEILVHHRIRELEWDNTRPRDMMDVASQRVAQS
ncbi:hypothetical protein Tco_1018965 [Tanacetum coccineum]|uniref:Uncharacterized protein n=1 Tax=Tanacetum coccineum TaxID=301880 RepID=A0ABQ5FX99_9ASTR